MKLANITHRRINTPWGQIVIAMGKGLSIISVAIIRI